MAASKTKPTCREKRILGRCPEAAGKRAKGHEALAHLFGAEAVLQPVKRGNRRNQGQSSRKPSTGLRRAERKMPRPAAQQDKVFEVNRCKCKRFGIRFAPCPTGVVEQVVNYISISNKSQNFYSIMF